MSIFILNFVLFFVFVFVMIRNQDTAKALELNKEIAGAPNSSDGKAETEVRSDGICIPQYGMCISYMEKMENE